MGKRGIRSRKGQAENDWGEPKSARTTIATTKTAQELAKKRAEQLGISVSEVIERWARGIAVDRDEVVASPNESIPPISVVLRALPQYTRVQLTRIVWAALTLLIGSPNHDPQEETITAPQSEFQEPVTIAKLVRAYGDLHELSQRSAVSRTRLRQIANGAYPEENEVILLSPYLKREDGSQYMSWDLLEIRDREFDGDEQEPEETTPIDM